MSRLTTTSSLNKADFDLDSAEYFHVYLEEDLDEKSFELESATSFLFSGLDCSMPFNKAANRIRISVLEQGIQFPTKWTDIGVRNRQQTRKNVGNNEVGFAVVSRWFHGGFTEISR